MKKAYLFFFYIRQSGNAAERAQVRQQGAWKTMARNILAHQFTYRVVSDWLMGHGLPSKEIQWRELLPFVRRAIFCKWGDNLCENTDSLYFALAAHIVFITFISAQAQLLWWFICATRLEEKIYKRFSRLLCSQYYLLWRPFAWLTRRRSGGLGLVRGRRSRPIDPAVSKFKTPTRPLTKVNWLGAYPSAFYLSSAYSFVSSAVSV